MRSGAPNDSLASAVAASAGRPEVLGRVIELYARLGEEPAMRRENCDRCGRCCDFASFGHRLYVTPIELALLTREPAPRGPSAGRCPYQSAGQCAAYDRRALGCRVFFCRGSSADEQALYERYHAELRRLHESAGIAYHYVELAAALAVLSER